jgi:hypothetical protein
MDLEKIALEFYKKFEWTLKTLKKEYLLLFHLE